MSKPNKQYWMDRALDVIVDQSKRDAQTNQEIASIFDKSLSEIDKEINAFYQKYADEKGISLADAQAYLNKNELAEFRADVKDYVKMASTNPNDPKLDALSARAHIQRLEALKARTSMHIAQAYSQANDEMHQSLADTITQTRLLTAYDIQKGTDKFEPFHRIDEASIDRALSKPWTSDGNTFSDRLWTQQDKLTSSLQQKFVDGFTSGIDPNAMTKAVQDEFGAAKYAAKRLVLTEGAYFASEAKKDTYKDLGVKQFEVLVTLDDRTDDECAERDGKKYPMALYIEGNTAPPFHPNCRCTTIPVISDNLLKGSEERAARDLNTEKTVKIKNMSFKDWQKTYAPETIKVVSQATIQQQNSAIIDYKKYVDDLHPEELAGVKVNKPMTFDEADHERANPYFRLGKGYDTNCQTCVVCHEARLRGYNLEALANDGKNKVIIDLSRHTNNAWIDPSTGKHPDYIENARIGTAKGYYKFLEKTLEKDCRYTIQFKWRNYFCAHIVTIKKDTDGEIFIFDPQSNRQMKGQTEILLYLKRMQFRRKTIFGDYQALVKLLRVDNMKFDPDVVNKVLTKSTSK